MRSVLLGVLLATILASPAGAFVKCRTWESLDDHQRDEALLGEIDRIVTSNDAKKYGSINKVQVGRCLERRIPEIRDQFDGICFEGKSAGMQALNREFERFVWTCVGRREVR